MSATDELRKLLDERGVEWACHGYENHTWWNGSGVFGWHAENRPSVNGSFVKIGAVITPEQAIAATLGSGECVPHGEWESISQSQEVRRVFCDCGYELGMDERDSRPFNSTRLFAMPNYCQECGRKIRKAVKR